ncbi:hypothetical protein M407DRAFT_100052 [Tulasnella calospora MUT 4182]|uniref:Uncharacterized protein n=1 Tax=Tulasnella calospora MUT 4182 TaxID=1051891 RepID=A0A0C3KSQ7_9AGAM|nr:hypothetical protein M407DRAFT_100052 [Tulasnella calospora MUT 4182]
MELRNLGCLPPSSHGHSSFHFLPLAIRPCSTTDRARIRLHLRHHGVDTGCTRRHVRNRGPIPLHHGNHDVYIGSCPRLPEWSSAGRQHPPEDEPTGKDLMSTVSLVPVSLSSRLTRTLKRSIYPAIHTLVGECNSVFMTVFTWVCNMGWDSMLVARW